MLILIWMKKQLYVFVPHYRCSTIFIHLLSRFTLFLIIMLMSNDFRSNTSFYYIFFLSYKMLWYRDITKCLILQMGVWNKAIYRMSVRTNNKKSRLVSDRYGLGWICRIFTLTATSLRVPLLRLTIHIVLFCIVSSCDMHDIVYSMLTDWHGSRS